MLKAVFFDLDGTLLKLNEEKFIKGYFEEIGKKVCPYGYELKQLIDVIWKGTYLMYQNDGCKTNNEVFWNYFKSVYGKENFERDKSLFDDFYKNEFSRTKSLCDIDDKSKKIVLETKKLVDKVVLSTNPVFPFEGQKMRLSFIGLKPEDFDFVTSYENSSFCKPNPQYFKFLLEKFNLRPDEVIVFGNNTFEDGDCASSCGIKCYLVKGYIIYSSKAKGKYDEVDFDEIIDVIKKEIELRK